ncbi:hypothetical protein AB0O68_33730 [Streptomyces sp. NPDC087512]|uniref:hypothetical protein n=1 Tax=Streptomyces sp. NPDC087512 TaxID=3155059 RepID=UPI003439A442
MRGLTEGPRPTCSRQQATPVQAAFRAAYHLPPVNAVAVGTDDPDHLRELTKAQSFAVDEEAVGHYRSLLRNRRQE